MNKINKPLSNEWMNIQISRYILKLNKWTWKGKWTKFTGVQLPKPLTYAGFHANGAGAMGCWMMKLHKIYSPKLADFTVFALDPLGALLVLPLHSPRYSGNNWSNQHHPRGITVVIVTTMAIITIIATSVAIMIAIATTVAIIKVIAPP